MPRKGRDFEKLVARIETILSGTEFKIRSPDRILDIHTGKEREIDISLRMKAGTHEILIIFECRARKKKEDVRWIEELSSKKASVQAAKAVAVSSSGFSQEAQQKAKMLNIELRLIEKLNLEDIQAWCSASGMTFFKKYNQPISAILVTSNHTPFPLPENSRTDASIFRNIFNTNFSLNDLVHNVLEQHPEVFSNLLDNKEPEYKWINILLDAPIYLLNGDTSIDINEVRVHLKLWIETVYVDASEIIQYSGEGGKPLTQAITFDLDIHENKFKVTASHRPEEGTKFSVFFEPTDENNTTKN
jgi:hypothetical protein